MRKEATSEFVYLFFTSIDCTASTAAATIAAEYPNGDRKPAFRSFSYLIASKCTLLLDIIPRQRAGPKSLRNEAPSRSSAICSF